LPKTEEYKLIVYKRNTENQEDEKIIPKEPFAVISPKDKDARFKAISFCFN